MAQQTSESLEYLLRQQSKVKTPKTLVKVVRAHTRELKRATRREHDKAVVEAAGGALRELIRGSFDVAEKTVAGGAQIVAAAAGDPNPITFGLKAVTMLAALAWFVASFPQAAKALHLDSLFTSIPKIGPPVDFDAGFAAAAAHLHDCNETFRRLGTAPPLNQQTLETNMFRARDAAALADQIVALSAILIPGIDIVSRLLSGQVNDANEVLKAVRCVSVNSGPFNTYEEAFETIKDKSPQIAFVSPLDGKWYGAWIK